MPAKPPKKLNRRHQELLMAVLLYPDKTQREIAEIIGMTESWVSTIINSDLFRAQRERIEGEYAGAVLVSLREKAEAVMSLGLDRLLERLSGGVPEKTEVVVGVVKAMDSIVRPTQPAAGLPPGPLVNISVEDLGAAREALRAVKRATEPLQQPDEQRRDRSALPSPELNYGLPEA